MSSVSESKHDQHSSFIKTPQQLIVVILASFLVPIVGIILLAARAVVYMLNLAGANFKEPPAARKPAAKK